MLCADECIGHAGVQMGEWSVHEVRVVQATCTVTFAGRPQQRREQRGWSRRRKESDEVVRASSLCSRWGTSYIFAASFCGRRPKLFAAEFEEVPYL